ncbi:hypothetical protein [Nocardioides sp. HB32]
MRLTEPVRAALLLINEGFTASTNYNSKNSTESRVYTIVEGHLQVRARGKGAWADSRYDNTFIADKEATHTFLRKHLPELSTDGLDDALAQVAAERASQPPTPSPSSAAVSDGAATATSPAAAPVRHLNVDKAVAALVGAGILAVAAAPHVGRLWHEHLQPRVERLSGRFAKTPHADAPEPETDEAAGPNAADGQDPTPQSPQ